MTARGDDVHEMPRRRPIDEQAVEEILDGTSTRDDLDGLHAFVVDVRTAAAGPMPAPSAELEHVLTRGFSTDKGDLPATAASNADGPAEQAAGLPKWRSAQMKVSRYVAGLSIAAKITLGAGCVFAATAGAGAAGVLPGPVQNAVDAVSPFSGDTGSDQAATTTLPPSGDTENGGTAATGAAAGDGASAGTGTGTGTDAGGGAGATSPGSGGTTTHDATTGSDSTTGTPGAPNEPTPTTTPTPTPTTAPPSGGDAPPPPPTTEVPKPQSMTIQCSLNAEHTAVNCEWTQAPPEGFGSYVLLRISDDGKPGRVLMQSTDITTHTWTDTLALTPGVTYSYMVDSIAPDGSTSGHSNYVPVLF